VPGLLGQAEGLDQPRRLLRGRLAVAVGQQRGVDGAAADRLAQLRPGQAEAVLAVQGEAPNVITGEHGSLPGSRRIRKASFCGPARTAASAFTENLRRKRPLGRTRPWTYLRRCSMKARLVLLVAAGVGPVLAAADTADWPQWRGPNRDARATG